MTTFIAISRRHTIPHFLVLLLLPMLLLSCEESPEAQYQRLHAAGLDYSASRDYQKALAAWNEILTFKNDSSAVFQQMGDSYYHLAIYPNALRSYKEALKLQPEDTKTRLKAIRIQLLLIDLDAALTDWQKIPPAQQNCEAMILHGDLLFLQRKYDEAEKEYKKCAGQNPQNNLALIRLAMTLFAQQKKAEADAVFQTLLDTSPRDPDILLQMGQYCLLINQHDKAHQLFTKATELAPQDLNLQFKLADFYLESGKLDQAVSILQKILLSSPDNRFAQKLLIESYLHLGRLEDARNLLDTFIAEARKDLEILLLKGKYFLMNNEYHAALSQFQMILDHEPNFPLAHYFLALSYLAGGQNKLGEKSLIHALSLNPGFTDAELSLATVYYKSNNYDLAEEHAERIKKREPENFRAYLILGNICLARKQYNQALNYFHSARLLKPKIVSPLYYEALTASLAGNNNNAAQHYASLLKKDPNLIDATRHYTKILGAQGKTADAVTYLEQAIINFPDNPYFHHLLGETYSVAHQRQKAIDSFQQSVASDSGPKSSYLKLFDLFQDDPAQLEKILKKALVDHPNFHQAQLRLALFYCRIGHPKLAITLLEEALSSSPKSPELANNLAWLYVEYQQEDLDEAMRLAQLAYEQSPSEPAYADTLGWIYFRKGMLGRASWLLEQAWKAQPDTPLVNFHLGMLLHKKGETEKAVKYLSFAVKNDLGQPFNDLARKMLTDN
ncbi:MAG: tetratricopeptide repeat protein [Desulfobacterales bacterium]|nr:MAG: tetratricopeptide repeat protein [Desulfobacterales bacterium]